MKRQLVYPLLAVFVISCSPYVCGEYTEFPIYEGTTWVYTYQAYEPSGSSIDSVIRATYRLTETVEDVSISTPFSVAHIRREYKLEKADAGWWNSFILNQNDEVWYVVDGKKVYSSNQPIDTNNINMIDYFNGGNVLQKFCVGIGVVFLKFDHMGTPFLPYFLFRIAQIA